jgi:SET domain
MELPVSSLKPGPNTRLVTSSGLAELKASVLRNGWDISTIVTVHVLDMDKWPMVNDSYKAYLKARADTKLSPAKQSPSIVNAVEEQCRSALRDFHASLAGCSFEVVDGHHRLFIFNDLKSSDIDGLPTAIRCDVFRTLKDIEYTLLGRRKNKIAHSVQKVTMYDHVLYIEFLISQLKRLNPSKTHFTEQELKELQKLNFDAEEVEHQGKSSSFNEWYNYSTIFTESAKELWKTYTSLTSGNFVSKRILVSFYQHCKEKFNLSSKNKRNSHVSVDVSVVSKFQERVFTSLFNIYQQSDNTLLSSTFFPMVLSHFDNWTNIEETCLREFGNDIPAQVKTILDKNLERFQPTHFELKEQKHNIETLSQTLKLNMSFLPPAVEKYVSKPKVEEVEISNATVYMDHSGESADEIEKTGVAEDEENVSVHEEKLSSNPKSPEQNKEQQTASDSTVQILQTKWIANSTIAAPSIISEDESVVHEWVQVFILEDKTSISDFIKKINLGKVSFVYANTECEDLTQEDIDSYVFSAHSALSFEGAFMFQCDPRQIGMIDRAFRKGDMEGQFQLEAPCHVGLVAETPRKQGCSNITLFYMLAFKGSIPKTMFNSSYKVNNEFLLNNTFPTNCNVLNGIDEAEKKRGFYQHPNTGKGLLQGQPGTPLSFLQEILWKLGGAANGEFMLDLTSHKTRMGECAVQNRLKYVGIVRSELQKETILHHVGGLWKEKKEAGWFSRHGIPSSVNSVISNFYSELDLEYFVAFLHGRQIFPRYFNGGQIQFTMDFHQDILDLDCGYCECAVDDSCIKGAGKGLYCMKDFDIDDVICPVYWGKLLLLPDENDSSFNDTVCWGNCERILKFKFAQPFLNQGGNCKAFCFIVGSKSSAPSYINTIHASSVWKTAKEHPGAHQQLKLMKELKVGPSSKNVRSAFNCCFEEISSDQFNLQQGTFQSFGDFLIWLEMPVCVKATRPIKAGEELYADYNYVSNKVLQDESVL